MNNFGITVAGVAFVRNGDGVRLLRKGEGEDMDHGVSLRLC